MPSNAVLSRPASDGIPADALVFTCREVAPQAEASFGGATDLYTAMLARPNGRTRVVETLYPACRYGRTAPAHVGAGDPEAVAAIANHFEELGSRLNSLPATVLCVSSEIRLSGDVLHYREFGALRVLYETCRLTERHVIEAPCLDEDRIDQRFEDGVHLLLASAGSFNYGHWLIDDMPRLEAYFALRRLHPGEMITILMPSYDAHMDEVRRRMVALYLGPRAAFRTIFLARDRVYSFGRLYHVTPCSLEPALKSPEATAAMRGRLLSKTRFARAKYAFERLVPPSDGHAWNGGRRLFVDRAVARGRTPTNRSEIVAFLQARGFEVIDPEALSPRQQVVRFARASTIVGIMGAAMTNVVFSPPGSRILDIAPDPEWKDPFFWDLAAICGHRYAAIYGQWRQSELPAARRNFTLSLDVLSKAIAMLENN